MMYYGLGDEWSTAGFAGGDVYACPPPGSLSVGRRVDDLTIKYWDGAAETWNTLVVEDFEVNASGQAEDKLEHDAAGNLIYDGVQQLTYDAWNRLVIVKRAYRDGGGVTADANVVIMEYDPGAPGHRRIQKTGGDGDSNSEVLADWEATFHYYHAPDGAGGQRMIETRNDDSQVLKQYVWGLTYIDELCQIAVNQDPGNADTGEATENLCERFFWGLQDTNFNLPAIEKLFGRQAGVLGVISHTGTLVERYEYTPGVYPVSFGRRRTIYSHGWSLGDMDGDSDCDLTDNSFVNNQPESSPASMADLNGDGKVDIIDEMVHYQSYVTNNEMELPTDDALVTTARLESTRGVGSVPWIPTGLTAALCDFGHQGLFHDRETGLLYIRNRYSDGKRFIQRDLIPYADGMSSYEYVRSSPLRFTDPTGNASEEVGRSEAIRRRDWHRERMLYHWAGSRNVKNRYLKENKGRAYKDDEDYIHHKREYEKNRDYCYLWESLADSACEKKGRVSGWARAEKLGPVSQNPDQTKYDLPITAALVLIASAPTGSAGVGKEAGKKIAEEVGEAEGVHPAEAVAGLFVIWDRFLTTYPAFWMKAQCTRCVCNKKVGVLQWGDIGKAKWIRCDLTKTRSYKCPGALKGLMDDGHIPLDVTSEEELKEIKEDCLKQIEEYCQEKHL